jgi:nickel-dependent lactate racemase
MQNVLLDYGDSKMKVELPDSAVVVRYKQTYDDPPEIDNYEATLKALKKPLGTKPLTELVKAGSKVVIGFPDRVKGGAHKTAHRKVAIPLIIEELMKSGVKIENITLLCAMGLHRKNTVEEWRQYLGNDLVNKFYPDRLINHDAEDEANLLDFGKDSMGNYVECNRLLAEADLPIIIGHCAGNPYGGFSGGYKMLVTGHTGQRSIGSHHRPETMHKKDWMGASTHSTMRHQFESIGKSIEEHIGKKVFAVDAVIGQKSQVLGVAAGTIEEVEKATWPLAKKRTNVELDMKEKADVLVLGIPRNFHYGPGMGTNPILSGLAMAGQLSRCWNVLHEDSVIIAASISDGWFNPHWFPSYEQTYEKLISYQNTEEFLHSEDSRRISQDYNYRWMYSNRYTYHPFHAMSMVSGYGILAKRTKSVIMVGAEKPQFARAMRYKTVGTYQEAVREAERLVGKNPKILCTPECFSGGVAVHLYKKGMADN